MAARQTVASGLVASLERKLGAAIFTTPLTGVVHVTAVGVFGSDYHTLVINEHGPKCDTDFAVLMACRAAADGVVQSAKTVRDEGGPASSLHLVGPAATELAAWRGTMSHIAATGCCAILTRTGNISADSLCTQQDDGWVPCFSPLLLVEEGEGAAAASTVAKAVPGDVEVVAQSGVSVSSAVQLLHERGIKRITLESGPSTTRSLYDAKCPGSVPDWLVLTRFTPNDAFVWHPSSKGALSLTEAELAAGFDCVAPGFTEETQDGQWHFGVYRAKGNDQVLPVVGDAETEV